jgi:hypothetical protein
MNVLSSSRFHVPHVRHAPRSEFVSPGRHYQMRSNVDTVSLLKLGPSLQIVGEDRCWPVFHALLDKGAIEDFALGDSVQTNDNAVEIALVCLAAGCRFGAFRCENAVWERTQVVGYRMRLAFRFDHEGSRRPIDVFTKRLAKIEREVAAELEWAWDILQVPWHKLIFDHLVNNSDGYPHFDLPNFREPESRGRTEVLTTVSAAAALGAVAFSNGRWQPTIFGQWLGRHQDSPLNRGIEVENVNASRLIRLMNQR